MNTHDKYVLPPLPEGWETELLDWVSACQSAYHIDNTPSHRFGGLGSNLEENRSEIICFVRGLIESHAAAAIEADRQARGEPVARVNNDGFIVETGLGLAPGTLLFTAPQPQQQAGEPFKSRRIDDVVRGLQASVAAGSDGEWVSIRREARDAAINRLQELNSDCAHMYESYVELASRSAPQPQQIPEDFLRSVINLCGHHGASPFAIEGFDPEDKWIAELWRKAEAMLLEAAPEVKP
ncbi:MAG: hypothetical protein GX086_07225 [Alcaligenaceae bacterium]|nr:hypothetical protein [Alcaligenaceae bacterium]